MSRNRSERPRRDCEARRGRNRTARRAFQTKAWRGEVDGWFGAEREQVIAANLLFQAVDVAGLDDRALAAHIAELRSHFESQARTTIANHGGDMIPVGDYLAHCARWGIAFGDAAALLGGSSPATTATAEVLAPAARAIAACGHPPAWVQEVRDLGAEASGSVDAWLSRFGWRALTTNDINQPTLAERPQAQLAALLATASRPHGAPEAPDTAEVRARVPAAQGAPFDELLAEARYGMRQRDDVVGIRWHWPAGLLRRALLEAGRRLAGRGGLEHAEHVVELSPEELEPLLVTGRGPDRAAIAARAEFRDRVLAAGPPLRLGDPEQPPPLEALPPAMARATTALMTLLESDVTGSAPDPLIGTGIGTGPYKGRARVVTGTDDALDRLQPGDVLVAPFTGPACNSILPILGTLVVENGGPLSHPAIVAREFGLPAVVGAAGATTAIPDGALVEVDPVRGTVSVVA